MTPPRTILQRFLPPWAPPKAPWTRVGDYIVMPGIRGDRRSTLALVEDRSLDRKRLQVRPWNAKQQQWSRQTTWILRHRVIAVVGKVTDHVNPKTPTRQDAPG